MKTTQITKPVAQAIGDDIMKALAEVEKKYGIKISRGNGKFTPKDLSFKITATVIGEGGQVENEEFRMLKIMKPEYVGLNVILSGKTFKIIGWRSKAPKNRYILEDKAGTKYNGPTQMVEMVAAISLAS